MNKNLPIGILDSGVGGLTVLKQTEKLLPKENIIYIGDTKRMPYGNKSTDEIIYFANKMIAFLESQNVKAILLACNTISSHIEKLTSNVPLFSIVEAGSEYALQKCKEDNDKLIGLIATKATVESGSYNKEINKSNTDIKIISNDSTRLPKVIDSQIENKPLLNTLIKECIEPILNKNKNVSKLILGCSHFPIIENEIKNIYKNLTLLDPAEQMVKNVKNYLKEKNLLKYTKQSHKSLYTTADILEFVSYIKRLKINIDKLEKIKLFEDD
ncbi:glutamate racemase [Anaerofustis sp.]|uniref:glutamate racemase n=1 Tax=Anaerofustis sp. TaxID=1872517 RepID=UPI0025B9F453|nr:glutamate racemase [Anaerofustis sp.]